MITQIKTAISKSLKTSAERVGKNSLRETSSLVGACKQNLSERFASFANDEGGNIAMMFGLTSVMLFTFTGLAVDYTRRNLVIGDMIEAMDAAGLAMGQYANLNEDVTRSDLIDFGEAVFRENFDHLDKVDDLQLEFAIGQTEIKPQVAATLDGLILGKTTVGANGFEFDHFILDSESTITLKGSGRIEMALVLDVTGSMNSRVSGSSTTKLEDMKSSVEALLDTLYGDDTFSNNISIGVVPFNAHVNVGDMNSSFDTNWLDLNADSLYHGARFIHAELPTVADQDVTETARRANSNGSSSFSSSFGWRNSTGIPKIMKPDVKVNHFNLFDSNSEFTWAGCVEARPYPLDELDIPAGVTTSSGLSQSDIATLPENVNIAGSIANRVDDAFDEAPRLSVDASSLGDSKNTRWVPMFIPDAPDCSSNSDCHQLGGGDNQGRSTTNIYGYPHGTYFRENWYDRPSGGGHNTRDYSDVSYIVDQSYIRDGGSNNNYRNFRIYNDFVLGFRNALGNGGNESSYWRSVEQRFNDIGADNFFTDEYIARTTYVGLFNPSTSTYSYRYDGSISENLNDSSRNPNQYCPDPILPLTGDRDEISDTVSNLRADGWTNSAFGTMWGWRLLSPEAPFTEGVPYDDGRYQKVAVIMTDGENQIASRDTHWGSVSSSYGFASEERMGEGINTANKMLDEIDNKMLRICQRMKDEGILVYTIIFGLESSSAEQLYRGCASEPNAPYFHDAANGVDLEEAFGDIAADLVSLHVSQ